MSSVPETSTNREHRTIYIVVAVVLVILVVIGLFTYSAGKSSKEADDKANQLIAALQQAGAWRVPSQDQIVGVLGNDGGAVCAHDPNGGLTKAILFSMLANGATGPGARPVIADRKVVQGLRLVIQIYCPDKLPDVQKLVDDLKYDDTINT
jgi:Tfp pilus assembly protein FimT